MKGIQIFKEGIPFVLAMSPDKENVIYKSDPDMWFKSGLV
jgi:hypothetical protein